QPIPILVGGHSEAAIDRAARLGDGWIAAGMSPQRLSEMLPILRAALARHDREPASIRLYCNAGRTEPTADELRKYADLGVHSLQIGIEGLDALKRFADDVLPRLR